jgi:hypothetical protein
MLDFNVFQTDPGVALDVLRNVIWTFLAAALGVEPERVGLELMSLRQASETTPECIHGKCDFSHEGMPP